MCAVPYGTSLTIITYPLFFSSDCLSFIYCHLLVLNLWSGDLYPTMRKTYISVRCAPRNIICLSFSLLLSSNNVSQLTLASFSRSNPSLPPASPLCHPSPQHVSEEEDNRDNEDDNEDDDEDEADNKKSETPHPHSPAANAASPGSKIDFLCNLSSDLVYTKFVDRLSSRKEVSVLLYNILIQSDIHCI